jgi:hypothetical protein
VHRFAQGVGSADELGWASAVAVACLHARERLEQIGRGIADARRVEEGKRSFDVLARRRRFADGE